MNKLFTKQVILVCIAALAFPVVAQIEEVVVTANKREQSVQDVSIAVTALTEEGIERAGIVDITGLENVVPGLRIGTSGGEVRPALRGARTNEVGVAGTGIAEQVVGIFQDGIYVPTTTAGMGAYVDIARIEVLRGPQGTLYGRNTFAGSINIVSNAPNFEAIEGSFKATTGNYNRSAYEAVLNIPHSSVLASRLVMSHDRHDGYIENLVQEGPSDDLRERNRFYLRNTTVYQPSEDFKFTFRLDHSKKNSNSEAIWGYQQIYGYSISKADNGSFNPTATVTPGHIYQEGNASFDDLGPYQVYRNGVSIDRQETNSISLIFDMVHNFANGKLTINNSTLTGRQYYDSDYSDGNANFVGGFGRDDDQTATSVEYLLTSLDNGSALSWVAGAYLFQQEAKWSWVSSTNTNPFPSGVTPTTTVGQTGANDTVNDALVVPSWGNAGLTDPHTADSTGVFGQATYSLNNAFRVVAGLRFNSDAKTFTGDIPAWDDTNVLWKLALEYDVNDSSMAYFSAGTGIRTGGANDGRAVSRGANALYDSEEVLNVEFGLKNKLLEDTLILNIAAFSNSYSDVKAQLFAVACNSATDTRTVTVCVEQKAATTFEYYQNGGAIDSVGLEVELMYVPSEKLQLNLGLAYLNSEFASDYRVGSDLIQPLSGLGNYEGHQDINSTTDKTFSFAGWRPALSPELSLNGGIVYDIDGGNGTIWQPSLQFSHVGDYYAFDVNTPETLQAAHTIVNAKLSWIHPDKNLQVDFFVNNATDEQVLRRAVVHSQIKDGLPINSVQANWNDPMTWGASIKHSF